MSTSLGYEIGTRLGEGVGVDAREGNCPYPLIYDPGLAACRAPTVLVWGDGNATALANLVAALDADGMDATSGGTYYDQTLTDFSAYDTVLWLEGTNYGNSLQPGVEQALVEHVASGKGLVRTEWGIWYATSRLDQGQPIVNPLAVGLLPFDPPADNSLYAYNPTHVVVQPAHPLARGIQASFAAGATGYVTLALNETGEAIVETTNGWPALSLSRGNVGRVVHINDSVALDRPVAELTSNVNVLKMYKNAVWYTAQRVRY